MANVCVFCGQELGRRNGLNLLCGNEFQPICKECLEKYQKAPPIQRARLVLETGRAVNPEGVRAFLEAEEEKEKRSARRRERQGNTLMCCGQVMTRLKGEYSFFDQTPLRLTHLRTPMLYLFRCELCGQVKFFDTSFFSEEQPEIDVPSPPETPERERVPLQSGQKPPWEK